MTRIIARRMTVSGTGFPPEGWGLVSFKAPPRGCRRRDIRHGAPVLIDGARQPQHCSSHASRRFYFPSALPATFRRASGIVRSSSLATGTLSRGASELGVPRLQTLPCLDLRDLAAFDVDVHQWAGCVIDVDELISLAVRVDRAVRLIPRPTLVTELVAGQPDQLARAESAVENLLNR